MNTYPVLLMINRLFIMTKTAQIIRFLLHKTLPSQKGTKMAELVPNPRTKMRVSLANVT